MKKFGSLVKISRAAAWLDCSKRHVYNLIDQKQLEAVKIGERGIRVTKESIDVYLDKINQENS